MKQRPFGQISLRRLLATLIVLCLLIGAHQRRLREIANDWYANADSASGSRIESHFAGGFTTIRGFQFRGVKPTGRD